MEVFLACERCERGVEFEHDGDVPDACPHCGENLTFQPDGIEDNRLELCVVCGGEHFYKHTKINQIFGLALLGIACLVFVYFVWQIGGMDGFLWGIGALFVAVGIDRLLYWLLPEVIFCYRCKTIYRGMDPDQEFDEYDHELEVQLKHRG